MIIVTGAAGFIGSNMIHTLNSMGISNILAVDELSNNKNMNLNKLDFFDIITPDSLMKYLRNYKGNDIEMIIHQGACSDTMETDAVYMMNNNYEYSKELLNYCIEQSIRFIYASSASVYGNGSNGFVEESSSENPLNIYAFSKYQFDRYVQKVQDYFTAQVVGLRYFNVYGQQENHKGTMSSTPYIFYRQALEGTIKVFEGSENFVRDFIHVDDVCKVNQHFLLNQDISGIFNCGTGEAHSFMNIAEAVAHLTGANIETIPFPNKLIGKYQAYTKADLTKLRTQGEFDDSFSSLYEGIAKYVNVLKESNGYIR